MAPKVTIRHETDDTPSQSIIKGANKVETVTDASGRIIGVRKMKALDRLRMFEVLGSENAKNEPYLGYAALAFHVCSIDSETITRPTSKLQLEALIQQLGDDGMEAVGTALQEMLEKRETEAAHLESIKN